MSQDRLQKLMAFFQADPTDAFGAYGIALELAKQGQPEQAIVWFDRALDIDPAYAYAIYHKAKTLSQMGRSDDARQVLEKGIAQASKRTDGESRHAVQEMQDLIDGL